MTEKKSSSWLKKILIIFSAFVALLVITMAVVPFFVDVDQYRPKVLAMVNEKINGKLEMGKLTLNLWGKFRVETSSVKLNDAKGKSILEMNHSDIVLPWMSLLTGNPTLQINLDHPKISVVKNKQGEINVLDLIKKESSVPTPPATPTAQTPTSQDNARKEKPTEEGTSVTLPSLLLGARIIVAVDEATLHYQDQASGLTNDLQHVNLRIKDLSLQRPSQVEFWSDVDTKMGKTLAVKGPIKMAGTFQPQFKDSEILGLDGTIQINLDSLIIQSESGFKKGSDIPLNAQMEFSASPEALNLKKVAFKFQNVEIQGHGSLKGSPSGDPQAEFKFDSNSIALAPLAEVFPMLKAFQLGGSLQLKGNVRGPKSALQYGAQISLDKVTFSHAKLTKKPTLNGKIVVQTDEVKEILINLKAPQSELSLKGRVQSFTRPAVFLTLTSKKLDLDSWVNLKDSESASRSSGGLLPVAHAAETKNEDYEAMLAPLRASEMVRNTAVDFKIQIDSLKAKGITLSNIKESFVFKDLQAQLQKGSLEIYSGLFDHSFSADLRRSPVKYHLDLDMKKPMSLNSAVASQMDMFKNTAYGKLSFRVVGDGANLNPAPAKKNLSLKGSFKLTDAVFASIDVGKMVTEGINHTAQRLGDKYPALKGKKINSLPQGKSEYEYMSSSFSIENGVLSAPDFVAKPKVNKGLGLRGATQLNLLNDAISAQWEVADTYNLTQMANVTIPVGGVQVVAFHRPNQQVVFPIKVEGTLDSPKYSYTQIPEHFIGVIGANAADALRSKAKDEVKKKVLDQAPPEAKKLLKRFGF